MTTKLITIEKAAEIFAEHGLDDLGPAWINDAIDRGQLPCTVVKRRRRVREDKVVGLIDRWVREAS